MRWLRHSTEKAITKKGPASLHLVSGKMMFNALRWTDSIWSDRHLGREWCHTSQPYSSMGFIQVR